MARFLQETQQVVWAEPHGGSVAHGVEVDAAVASVQQVLVQDQAHTVVLVEEQSESSGTSLPHLRGRTRVWTLETRSEARKACGASLTGLLISQHLQLLQHGGLIGKAQVAAADAQLLGEVVEVDLRGQRG